MAADCPCKDLSKTKRIAKKHKKEEKIKKGQTDTNN
jgi:hypothetical protein